MALRHRIARDFELGGAGARRGCRRGSVSCRRGACRCAQCGRDMNAPNIDSSNVRKRGIFFDGVTTASHDVVVELAPRTLRVHGVDGSVLAEWPYDELETLSSPEDVLR